MSARLTKLPVGLFGLHTNTNLTRSRLASMLGKSSCQSVVNGTFLRSTPKVSALIAYMP
ncbi:Uncharacterised protein [Vibrio cholerae]|nr:Uncharacterised protein [Vibrio cholerae]